MKKRFLLLACFVLLAGCLVLTACGGAGDPVETTPPATTLPPVTSGTPSLPTASFAFEDVTATYDGTAKTIAVTGLPEGSSVVYTVNGGEEVSSVSVTDAGVYTVVAKITVPATYAPVADQTATLTVNKAVYTLADAETYFADAEVPYNGTYQSPVALRELPAELGYTVEGTLIRNAGESVDYTVTFYFNDSSYEKNYLPPVAVEGVTLTIVKADIDMSGVTFEDDTVPYDGAYHNLAITGELPAMLDVEYSAAKKEKGEHTVTATFFFKNDADAANYNVPAAMTAKMTIGAGEYDLSGYNFGDRTVSYNGINQFPVFPEIPGLTLTVTAKKGGTTVTEAIIPGTYDITVSFSVNNPDEYLVPESKTFTLTIEKGVIAGLTAPTWSHTGNWVTDPYGYFFYDGAGEPPTVELKLPEILQDPELYTVSVSYVHKLNGQPAAATTAPGIYTTTATLSFSSDLYVLPEDYAVTYTYEWRVATQQAPEGDVTFAADTVPYDGAFHKLLATYEAAYITGVKYYATVGGEMVEITDGFNAVGQHTVTAVFDTDAASGYAPFTREAVLEITPATIDLKDVDFEWNYSGTPFTKDGSTFTVTLTADTVEALAALGVTVESYTGNSASAEGEYLATVKLACDANHVLSTENATLNWGIALSEEDSWTDETIK